jgi:hypothetical protein
MSQAAVSAILGLEGIEVLGASASDELVELVVESKADAGCCRGCGGLVPELKERPVVLIRDLPVSGGPVMSRWRKGKIALCLLLLLDRIAPPDPSPSSNDQTFQKRLADKAAARQGGSPALRTGGRPKGLSWDTVAKATAGAEFAWPLPQPAPDGATSLNPLGAGHSQPQVFTCLRRSIQKRESSRSTPPDPRIHRPSGNESLSRAPDKSR